MWNPAGPGPSYGDVLEDGTRAGVDNEFTQRNTTFMTWNLLHLARMLRAAGGFPAYGNQRREWDAGARFDFPNPESRVPLLATSYVPGRAHCADGLAAAARRSSTLWVGGHGNEGYVVVVWGEAEQFVAQVVEGAGRPAR